MSGLVIPTHVANARTAELVKQREEAMEKLTWDQDGLTAADLPAPSGWRILIEPVEIEQKTKGGVILADQSVSDARYLCYLGKVIAVGPAAYKHTKFAVPQTAIENGLETLTGERVSLQWCSPGDYVVYGRYAGQEVQVRGDSGKKYRFRFINDDEVLATAPSPDKLAIYV